jgi:hypothetical protein
MLQLLFERVQRIRVQQVPELGVAQQLPQLCLIDRKGLCPPLRQRATPTAARSSSAASPIG